VETVDLSLHAQTSLQYVFVEGSARAKHKPSQRRADYRERIASS